MKVWGRLSSINVQKVVWCLDELGLAYERIDAGGAFGVVGEPEYRAKNPNGLIPTIEDGDFVLWESNAIVRYLASGHPEAGLWPESPRARADADRWMDWQATAATPAIRDAFWQLVRGPPEARDPEAIASSIADGEQAAAILDEVLGRTAYVAGDAFSVGDIATGAFAHRWLNMPIDREPRPNLEHWYRGLGARPGAMQVLSLPVT